MKNLFQFIWVRLLRKKDGTVGERLWRKGLPEGRKGKMMKKKTIWLLDGLFGFCMAMMLAMYLPITCQAAGRFGEVVAKTITKWSNQFGSAQSDNYQIEEDGVLTISITDISATCKLDRSGLCLVVESDGEDGHRCEIIPNIEKEQDGLELKVGVKKGNDVDLRFWVLMGSAGSGTISFKYSVDFDKGGYYECMDERLYVQGVNGSYDGIQVYWAKSYYYAAGAIPLDAMDVMYTGFLNGHGTLPYEYDGVVDCDDVDVWDVELQKNVEYRIYFDGLDGAKKASANFFVTLVTPTRTYNNIQNSLQYDSEKRLYYYPYKAVETGTCDIRIGGKFGNNKNMAYSLGVYPIMNGWYEIDGKEYWYENNIRQGFDPEDPTYRGKEIYDPGTDAWYWLDNVQEGAKAVSKDVYQESDGGKWVRYDSNGGMVKGWHSQDGRRYYFDLVTGAMYKGFHQIDGTDYCFDNVTGGLYTGWISRDGKDYWYEDGVQQGLEGRGKEIYDPGTDAWYWLDSIYGGAKAVDKEVYQDADGGKWVRYDSNGGMIKGWYTIGNLTYYYDLQTGAMLKGRFSIDGTRYHFDEVTGILQ